MLGSRLGKADVFRPLSASVKAFGGWEFALLVLLVVEIVAFSQGEYGFWLGGAGALTQLQQFIGIAVASMGLGLVILTGGIDLSIGSVASLTGVVMARLWASGLNIWVAVLIALVVACAIGTLNGLIITYGKLHPLIVTLVTMFVVSSVAEVVVGTPMPYVFPSNFVNLGMGAYHSIPWSVMVFVVVAICAGYLVGFTTFGRELLMIGSNPVAAAYAGIRVRRVLVIDYTLCALSAGIAGILMSALYASARGDLAAHLLLPALTAVVLGGVDIFGGSGRVRGMVLGVLLIGFLQQGMMLYGVNAVDVQLVTGILLGAAVVTKNMSGSQRFTRRLRGLRHTNVPPPVPNELEASKVAS
jgi:ribose/xylose/arabinose/galactoside ABC-type transport system permease subunit